MTSTINFDNVKFITFKQSLPARSTLSHTEYQVQLWLFTLTQDFIIDIANWLCKFFAQQLFCRRKIRLQLRITSYQKEVLNNTGVFQTFQDYIKITDSLHILSKITSILLAKFTCNFVCFRLRNL